MFIYLANHSLSCPYGPGILCMAHLDPVTGKPDLLRSSVFDWICEFPLPSYFHFLTSWCRLLLDHALPHGMLGLPPEACVMLQRQLCLILKLRYCSCSLQSDVSVLILSSSGMASWQPCLRFNDYPHLGLAGKRGH